MVNYRAQKLAQLKQFVEKNNIKMGDPSGMNGGFIKTDYLAAITKHLDSLFIHVPPKKIFWCEWFLISLRDKCCMAVARVAHLLWKMYISTV